ncbi:hypothetical protein O6H91_02G142000 [Diphasiastrum complanatum]|uniref:Uncharacterized protein n=1 Tax=Diphasiastrum complanatum TaxID=34168 RepID=A0ACC2ELG1_DIPCM|nr:hypothetical protein O6H91_02G142000 [Diphasiastrum complanatum]
MSHSGGGSSGGFSGSSSSAHGFSGSSGTFPSQSTFSHRSDPNNIFIYTTTGPGWDYEQGGQRRQLPSKAKRGSVACCHVVPSIFAVFGSFWLLFGLYGSRNLELGLNYSRLFEANSLLVKEIQIQNSDGVGGPTFYGFSKHPALNKVTTWSNDYDVTVEGQHHQEWAFWLNRGSIVKLEYHVDAAASYMLVAILKGEDNLNEWLKNPRDSGPTVSWHNIHGKGRIDYGVDKDDDYYFALGNLHDQSVQMHLQIHFDAKLYNTETADFRCSFLSDTCRKEVSLVGSSFALLITPARVLDGVDVWHVKVTYGARWATYISTVGAISAAFFIRRKKNSKRRQDTEDDPLIGTTTTDSHGDYKSSGTSSTEGTEPSAPVQPRFWYYQ